MSKSSPASREEFRDWCMRRLGAEVIRIEISPNQIEDCIDSAIQFFRDFHYDGTEKWYLSHQITQDDIDNKYVEIPDDIIGVTRCFPIGSTNASINMFDLRYQLRLHDLYDFTSTSYVNYVLTQQHIRTLDLLFSGETMIRFNRHTHRVYLDDNWSHLQVGEYIVLEGYKVLDMEAYTDVWNDRMLKKLAVAHLKMQWGSNTRKYDQVKLLGGIVMTGEKLYLEAEAQVEQIEEEIRTTYQEPPGFLIG